MSKVIFLDRDGVLNEPWIINKRPYPPSGVETTAITVGIREVLAMLSKWGYLIICVTNQPDVGRGIQTKEEVEKINNFLRDNLPIDCFFTCYHTDEDNCDCRKPKLGLFKQAWQKYPDIEFPKSWMIGDRWKDVEAGRKVGCKTIFIDYGYDEKQPDDKDVDIRIKSISEILGVIDKHDNRNMG
jgi:D-glycero-D-manno-heptose 1,7-bisphosphate phosphatase